VEHLAAILWRTGWVEELLFLVESAVELQRAASASSLDLGKHQTEAFGHGDPLVSPCLTTFH
jgi:hypothetical protein